MASYVHADRQITATTPLGPDVLLLRGFSGVESLSQLFHFRLEMQAEDSAAVPFDRLIGQKVTIRLALDAGEARYINGVCNRVRRGVPDATFTPYDLEIVPQFWFLTRSPRAGSFSR